MYVLCKLITNDINNSVLRHPMNVIMRSIEIGDISNEIIKRVHDGAPINSFKVYEEVDFKLCSSIVFESEAEE